MYIFADSEAPNALDMIRLHVMEGQLHPYAGMILMEMVVDDAD
jgi:hypothetical protein